LLFLNNMLFLHGYVGIVTKQKAFVVENLR